MLNPYMEKIIAMDVPALTNCRIDPGSGHIVDQKPLSDDRYSNGIQFAGIICVKINRAEN